MRLADKVVLLTGASGGIGMAAARRFVQEGANIMLVDVDEGALKRLAEELGTACGYVVADVSQPEPMEHAVRLAVERHGGIDVFVANAGIEGTVARLEDYPLEAFDRVLDVNVRGVFIGLKAVIPVLRERGGGSIVITSSEAGVSGVPKLAAYSASKHAVIGLMRSAARECARYNIRVNTVNPGPVETRMMRSIEDGNAPGAGDTVKQKMTAAVPMRRYAQAEEVASMMAFLASDDSSYCTGGIYMVDGGASS